MKQGFYHFYFHFVYPLGFAFSYDPTGRESHAKGGQADVYPPKYSGGARHSLRLYSCGVCVAKGSQ
jgi:hypothetical protein